MRAVSAAFLRAVTGSHQMIARARVCTRGQTGTNPTGTEVSILAGDVRFSATDPVRANLDLTIDGTSLWPTAQDLLLSPYGNEIYVERGIDFGGGRREWVGLGYYRIDTPAQDDILDGPIAITATDRMQGLIDCRMVAPRQFTASTTYATCVANLVQEVFPGATIDWDSGSTGTLGRPLICEQDRWEFLDKLVSGLGKIWYWDYRGRLQIKDPPAVGSPVIALRSGRGGVLTKVSRSLTRIGVFNIIVASGESTDSGVPVSATAYDDDPNSPTYWRGDFGPVPDFVTSPVITTQANAKAAARTALRKQLGLPYELNFEFVPNPALEPWDVVELHPSPSEQFALHTLAELTIPLTAAEAMTGTSREQTTLRIGVY